MNSSHSLNIVKAKKSDKKAIQAFYKQQHYSAKLLGLDHCYLIYSRNKVSDLATPLEPSDIIACVIVSQLESNNSQFFLHGLVVERSNQKQGLATCLIKHALTNHNTIVCFAQPSLSKLYTQHGMTVISEEMISETLTPLLKLRFCAYRKKHASLLAFIVIPDPS